MADKKISELVNITGSNIADTDEFVVVDSSASETKAITASELRTAVGNGDFTVTGNLTVQGTTITVDSATAQNIVLGDNDKMTFGAGSDLWIYSDGTNSFIEERNGTGSLYIDATDLQLRSTANAKYFRGIAGGAVDLYYDNASKLATTSTGIDVTGTVTADGLSIAAQDAMNVNGYQPFVTLKDGNAANKGFRIQTADGNTLFSNDVSGGGTYTERMRIAADGSVGIGTSSPSFKLSLGGETSQYGSLLYLAETGHATSERAGMQIGGWVVGQDQAGNGTKNFFFYDGNTSQQRMLIDPSGNVGIGTSSPQAKLDVNSEIRVTSGANIGRLLTDGSDFYVGTSANIPMRFETNSTTQVIIDTSGNVGIGTTSPSKALELGLLDAFRMQTGSVTMDCTPTAGATDSFVWNTSANAIYRWDMNGTERMRIDSSGNLLVGKTSADGTATDGSEIRDGRAYFSAASGSILHVNRTTTDGEIIDIRKNGSTVGSIGTAFGYIWAGTGDVGLSFRDTLDAVLPFTPSGNTNRDAAIDLGYSSTRFKDLYLSGGIEIENGTGNVGVGKLALNSNTASYNTAVGYQAGYSNTTGERLTAVGYQAAYNTTTGGSNTAIGFTALDANTTGTSNTAVGAYALTEATTATNNTAVGEGALLLTTTGSSNEAVGFQAMRNNTTGFNNAAMGYASLYSNTSGTQNAAFGHAALNSNTTASNNTAVGYHAGYANTTGQYNTAIGGYSLDAATTASGNVGLGFAALTGVTTANSNVAVGAYTLQSLTTGVQNTAVGSETAISSTGTLNAFFGNNAGYAQTTGDKNTYIGQGAGFSMTTGGSNTILGRYNGNQGGLDIRTSSNNIVLSDGDGNPRVWHQGSYLACPTVYSFPVAGRDVYVDSNGTVGYLSSVREAKTNITDFTDASWLLNLLPKTFNYRTKDADNNYTAEAEGELYYGLIADEVEAVNPNLCFYNDVDGQQELAGVSYSKMITPMLKLIQEQQATITALEARITALENA